jgi:RNA polymerase sigma-70 factor (ECF subfamily)
VHEGRNRNEAFSLLSQNDYNAYVENDEDLIVTYLEGEDSAFELLVQRHLKLVYSFVFRFVGNEKDAEDIVQETFIKAWKNLKNYSRQSSRFKTWLMHIARNTAIDYLRKKQHVPFSKLEGEDETGWFAENLPDEALLPEELLAHKGDVEDLERAMLEISPVYREVLLLYYGSNLTFEEAATISGIGVNTLKSRHRRAVAELRKLLVHLNGT